MPLLIVLSFLVLIALYSGLLHRKAHRLAPGARWRRTDEVFRDPSTGRTVRVWVDPRDGGRHFVPEGRARK
jgi:hypothetical protein